MLLFWLMIWGLEMCIPPKVHEGYWVAPMELGRGEETQQFQVKKEMRLWKTDSIFFKDFLICNKSKLHFDPVFAISGLHF